MKQAYERLSPSRKEHIDRLKKPEDKRRSLTGELLVQKLVAEQFSVSGAILHRSANGQPYLTGCELYVSIAHCDEKVACAVSHTPVGMDIEKLRPVNLKLCRHICTAEEKEYLLQGKELEDQPCEDPEVIHRFFRIWTAKEAYFKKLGTGITDLKSVNTLPLQTQLHIIDGYMVQIL
ncbi:MAG: 4'-phosphopantetheinyl transferase superfamily protein [Oscillospiraceae bacterium]|nr:4'-phosphopantetheinyl transferase superfamily protein [Oscillospiraceae bacterium]